MTKEVDLKREGLSICNNVDDIVQWLQDTAKSYDIETVHITKEDHYVCFYGIRKTEVKKEMEGMTLVKGKDTYTQTEQFSGRVDLCKYLDEYKKEKKKWYAISKKKQKEYDKQYMIDMIQSSIDTKDKKPGK